MNDEIKILKQALATVGDYHIGSVSLTRFVERLENAEARGIHSCHESCERVECILRRKVEAYEKALESYTHCKHACMNCSATLEARAVLEKYRGKG